MIEIVHTIQLTGTTEEDYAKIAARLEALHRQHPEWELLKLPPLNRVTAIKTEQTTEF